MDPEQDSVSEDELPEEGELPEAEEESDLEPAPRRGLRDIVSVAGLVMALGAAGVYYYYFVREKPVPQQPPVAKFTALEGQVSFKRMDDTIWVDAQPNGPLRTRDQVRTGANSGAEVTFNNGNVVRVTPGSVILIVDPGDVSMGQGASWSIEAGEADFEIEQSAEIVTPTARTTAARNSAGNIAVDEETTGIRIFAGSARVSTQTGQTIELNENEGLEVDATGAASEKQVLPDPPVLVEPPGESEIARGRERAAAVRLTWEPVPLGASYRVAMDYNVTQANLLLSAALDADGITGTTHELSDLGHGKYYWRVAAVNEGGLAGRFSKVSQFAVIEPPEPELGAPTLVVSSFEVLENMVQLSGRTDPGNQITVDGHPIKVRPDGSFSEYLRRPPGAALLIRATGPTGEVTEEERPVGR